MTRRQVEYGVEAANSNSVGTALLWTLEQGFGLGFTHDTPAARAKATLSQVVKDVAYAPS